MVEENVMPDRHTMSILIRSCLAADVPSEAEGLLKKMISHGIDLNSYVFNIVIDYYARKALPLEAFRMRQNMEQSKPVMTPRSWKPFTKNRVTGMFSLRARVRKIS